MHNASLMVNSSHKNSKKLATYYFGFVGLVDPSQYFRGDYDGSVFHSGVFGGKSTSKFYIHWREQLGPEFRYFEANSWVNNKTCEPHKLASRIAKKERLD